MEANLMENQSPEAVINSEEIPDHFLCCVCLDLLYKPIVLRCGHISCFWCVHNSMNSRYESRCPICRNPYSHFPAICQMLHFLLLKLYPIAYKKRELQILEEERKLNLFSPEFNFHACESQADGTVNYLGSPACSSAAYKENLMKPSGEVESHCNGVTWRGENSNGDLNQIKPVAGKETDQVSVADLLCTACKQMLFRPVVLNCGHVYCQTCISIPSYEMLRCQVCQCLQPRGFPKVCLTLDQFLATKFPEEYALRRDAVQPKQASSKCEETTSCSVGAANHDSSPIQLPLGDHLPSSVEPSAFIHRGVGCDACGMYPIAGYRYKCKDCTEKIGFDLCGDCYNSRSKLPGRFNQRHTPEHSFELIKHDIMQRLSLITRSENGSSSFFTFGDASENIGNGIAFRFLSGDSQDNSRNNLAAPFLHSDNIEDEDDDTLDTD